MKKYKFVVHSPLDNGELIRQAIGETGGGRIGDYDFCSFTVIGTGRSRGNDEANPVYGEVNTFSSSEEERIEVTVTEDILKEVINAVLAVHPYDQPTYDVYLLEDL